MKTVRFTKNREVAKKGEVKTLLDSAADNLVARGYAEYVEDAPVAKAPAETETAAKPLSKMTVAELQAYAKENSIDLGEAKTKAEIVAVIEKPKAPAAEPAKEFSEYTIEELVAYAASNNIALGEATELEDVLEIVENMAPKP